MEYLLAFLGMAFFDVVYALFNRALARDEIKTASMFSGILTGLAGLVVIEYSENHLALLAACLGSVLGTFLGMLIDRLVSSEVD